MLQPRFRQAIVLFGLLCCSISNGYIFGQMSGMLAALHAHDDGINLTNDDISWIASSMNITSVCGFAVAAIITESIGRRKSFTVFSLPIIINWIMLYYAEEMIVFMISRIFVGVCFGGVLSMYIISTPEYTSPNIRGVFLNMMTSVGPGVGTALGHIFGIVYHWRTVALIGIVPTALGAILPMFWEESPSWLASKGRFEECNKAFKRLHGNRATAEMELQILTEVERCKMQKIKENDSTAYFLKKLMMAWKKKYFWNILLLSCVINVYIAAAGKLLYSTLAITMLEEITGSKNILMFTLLVDGFVILGTILSLVLIKKMKMRTLLFSTGITANILLVLLSGCMYFHPEKGGYYAWINCGILALYFIVVNAGPYPVLEAFIGEIFPLEFKGYFFFLSGIVLSFLLFLSIKLADDLFRVLGYHGVFLLNAGIMTLCLIYVWVRLPETKGRTMQEIELYFKNDTFEEVEKVLNGEQIKVLI
ncbi:trehalose transporter 1-like protein [Epargyreus clarus]|uniref:trehalose transporter 1-like protein n=1 Tax=Epargyreus clarus TaxID=520877 RepID=UPI003C2ED50B